MKYLLIILLTVPLCSEPDHFHIPNTEVVILTIIQEYDNYAAECASDTGYFYVNSPLGGQIPVRTHVGIEPTFQGFIEYIRKIK